MKSVIKDILFFPLFGVYFILVKVFKLNMNWNG